jgi:hypothetical protein
MQEIRDHCGIVFTKMQPASQRIQFCVARQVTAEPGKLHNISGWAVAPLHAENFGARGKELLRIFGDGAMLLSRELIVPCVIP